MPQMPPMEQPVAMTPEEFSMETRFVILNFLGLVPAAPVGDRVQLAHSNWGSSSSSSFSSSSHSGAGPTHRRSLSQHSRTSSTSSHREAHSLLPEFMDTAPTESDQVKVVVPHHASEAFFPDISPMVASPAPVPASRKRPLNKSRSLPHDAGPSPKSGSLHEHGHHTEEQQFSPTSGKAQLRKTKSHGTELGLDSKSGQSTQQVLSASSQVDNSRTQKMKRFALRRYQKNEPLDEEQETDEVETDSLDKVGRIDSNKMATPCSSQSGTSPLFVGMGTATPAVTNQPFVDTASDNHTEARQVALSVPSGTPTGSSQLFVVSSNLSLSSMDTDTPLHREGTQKGDKSYLPVPATSGTIGLGFEEGISEMRDRAQTWPRPSLPTVESNSERGRSQSPARPMTLDLSENAPRSPLAPNWKELVESPERFTRTFSEMEDEVVDSVDHYRNHKREQKPAAQVGGGMSTSEREEDTESTQRLPGNVREIDDEALALAAQGGELEGEHTREHKEDSGQQGDHEKMRPTETSLHTPRSIDLSLVHSAGLQRQSSVTSTGSSSLPSPVSVLGDSCRSGLSSRTSLSEFSRADIATLVQNNVLPRGSVQLKEELSEQWKELEETYEEALDNQQVRDIITPASDSPESEVARRLAVIGDQVQEEYGEQLDQALRGLLTQPLRHRLTYEVFIGALLQAGLISSAHIEGWKQVALVLLLSQRLALLLVQRGERHLRDLVDVTTEALNNRAATFILDQGGWGALSELELDSPVSVSDIDTHLIAEGSLHREQPDPSEPDGPSSLVSSTTTVVQSDNSDNGGTSTSSHQPGTSPPTADAQSDSGSDPNKMSASPSDENSNKSKADGDVNDGRQTAAPVAVPTMGTNGGHLTPEEVKSIEDAVNNVRQEIRFIRQVSSELRPEAGNHDNGIAWQQVAALGAGLVASIGLGALLIYRYRASR